MLHTILPWKACCLAASSANVDARSPGFLGPTEGKFKHQYGSDPLYVMDVSQGLLLLSSSQVWTLRVLFIDILIARLLYMN